MKKILLVIVLIVFSTLAFSQKARKVAYYDKIDTLSIHGDSILAKIQTYRNDTLIRISTAFLIPDSIRVPRFRLTGNLIKATVYVDKIIWEGQRTGYLNDGQRKVSEYKNGKEISSTFFNKNQKEIPKNELLPGKDQGIRGPCGEVQSYYFIKGKKKKK